MLRVASISGVVPIQSKQRFQHLCMGLTKVADIQDLRHRANAIIEEFPLTRDFMTWWLHPDRAPLIFAADRVMDPGTFSRLPETTNAEESQHNKLYSISGRGNDFLEGAEGLHTYSEYCLRMYLASRSKFRQLLPDDTLTYIYSNQPDFVACTADLSHGSWLPRSTGPHILVVH